MRKREQRLWDRMRNNLKDQVYLERIENIVSPGRPDVDVAWEGVILPIELKALDKYPHRPDTPVLGGKGLNQNQLNWWLNWKFWGGKGFIVVGVAGDIFAVPAHYSDVVNNYNRQQLCKWAVTWKELVILIRQESECLLNR